MYAKKIKKTLKKNAELPIKKYSKKQILKAVPLGKNYIKTYKIIQGMFFLM